MKLSLQRYFLLPLIWVLPMGISEVHAVPPSATQILTPTDGQVFEFDEAPRLTVAISESNGPASVTYWSSNSFGRRAISGSLTTPPFEFRAVNLPLGETILIAKVAYSSETVERQVSVQVVAARGLPVIATSWTNSLLPSGSNLTLTATVTSALPTQLQWLHNGQVVGGATTASLVINNSQSADSGFYTLLASNDVGVSASAAVYVAVTATNRARVSTPSFAIPNRTILNAILMAGPAPEALFPVSPPLSFSGSSIAAASRFVSSVAAGDVAFVQVRLQLFGSPTNWVSNLVRVQTSITGAVTVTNLFIMDPQNYPEWPDPIVSLDAPRLAASVEGAVEIHAQIFCFQDVSYRWKRNGIDIPGSDGFCGVAGSWFPPTVWTNIALVVPHTSPSDVGAYSIAVQSMYYPHLATAGPTMVEIAEPKSGRILNPLRSNDTFIATVQGRLGLACEWWTSIDFSNWSFVSRETNSTGQILFQHHSPSDHRFYRAVLVP